MDLTVPESTPALGRTILGALGESGGHLGVQRVIYWERVYDAASPSGRPYGGASAHRDHLHIELTRAAAEGLSEARAMALLDQVDEEMGDVIMLLVAWRGAQWAVRSDLSGKVGLASSDDVRALAAVGGGRVYFTCSLSDTIMSRIPTLI